MYAGKHSEQRLFLRGGADVLAAIVITAGFGVGIVVTIAGIAITGAEAARQGAAMTPLWVLLRRGSRKPTGDLPWQISKALRASSF